MLFGRHFGKKMECLKSFGYCQESTGCFLMFMLICYVMNRLELKNFLLASDVVRDLSV